MLLLSIEIMYERKLISLLSGLHAKAKAIMWTGRGPVSPLVFLFLYRILYIQKFSPGFYFRETSHMQCFVEIKSSGNGEITVVY